MGDSGFANWIKGAGEAMFGSIIKSAAWQLLRVSYEIGDWGLIGSYVWNQIILRRKPDTKTDYFD